MRLNKDDKYKENKILRQLVAEIPWGYNLLILHKAKNEKEKEYYIRVTIEIDFNRDVPNLQIKNKVIKSYPKAKLNYKKFYLCHKFTTSFVLLVDGIF